MVRNRTQQMVISGLLVALGLLLPFATSHGFGLPGTLLLPMHIPVLLCGLLCGPLFGGTVGVVVPVLSCMLTGMPAAYPMLPIMAAQLLVLGTLSGLLRHKLGWGLYPTLLVSMTAGWAVYGLVFAGLTLIGGGLRALSVTAAILQGIPGIAIQLTLIPALVKVLSRARVGARGSAQPTAAPADDGLSEALEQIAGGAVSCVVLRDGAVDYTADGRGVSPLLQLYDEHPEKIRGAFVVDKIIGKAAAMILVLGGVRQVYGVVMSVAGRDFLEGHGVIARYGRCVDVITNRSQTGICPIEKSLLDVDDPAVGLARITDTIAQLRVLAG